jgi:hypothetical protein
MIQRLMAWLGSFGSPRYPNRLKLRGRRKLPCAEFRQDDRLFRAATLADLDDQGRPVVERIRFPGFSCNWSRFSEPADVRLRHRGLATDGCYSFTVETSRFRSYATPVHDPLESPVENYAHVEVRQLMPGESVLAEPPPDQERKGARSEKLAYRQNLSNNATLEIWPEA